MRRVRLLGIDPDSFGHATLPSGAIQARVYLGPHPTTGKAWQPTASGPTAAAADEALLDRIERLVEEFSVTPFDGRDQRAWRHAPLHEYLDFWMDKDGRHHRADQTVHNHRVHLRHIKAALGLVPLGELQTQDVSDWITHAVTCGLPQCLACDRPCGVMGCECDMPDAATVEAVIYPRGTVGNWRSTLNVALRYAVANRWLPYPISVEAQFAVASPRVQNVTADEMRARRDDVRQAEASKRFTPAEVDALLATARTSTWLGRRGNHGEAVRVDALLPPVDGVHSLYACVNVMLYGMLRIGEAVGLWWGDLDLDSGRPTMTVDRQYNANGTYSDTKTSHVTSIHSTVPISQGLADVLRAHRARLQALGVSAAPDAPVFPGTDGQPVPQSRLRYWLQQHVLEPAGIDHGSPRTLRHTGNSLLAAGGVPAERRRRLARHSPTSDTNETTYTHLSVDDVAGDTGHLTPPGHNVVALTRRAG